MLVEQLQKRVTAITIGLGVFIDVPRFDITIF